MPDPLSPLHRCQCPRLTKQIGTRNSQPLKSKRPIPSLGSRWTRKSNSSTLTSWMRLTNLERKENTPCTAKSTTWWIKTRSWRRRGQSFLRKSRRKSEPQIHDANHLCMTVSLSIMPNSAMVWSIKSSISSSESIWWSVDNFIRARRNAGPKVRESNCSPYYRSLFPSQRIAFTYYYPMTGRNMRFLMCIGCALIPSLRLRIWLIFYSISLSISVCWMGVSSVSENCCSS